MDTRTRSTSPVALMDVKMEQSPPLEDKISAYYSLVFPHFTFYIQTLSVTIGRRCAPSPHTATSSTAGQPAVDVDLGALKSVSRLHAKIEYDQDEDRFVLAVIGRNGAWVDGVWCGSGTRAPLGERSQIQIASRTFHFILPPPPPPEDTPSPSSQSSTNRPRSPSVDITSISPPSSQPSNSPPPPADRKPPAPLLEPQLPPSPSQLKPESIPVSQPQLPNSNSIGKSSKTSKKRKKSDVEPIMPPKPKPEDMPPKPPFTYAQLIYRAIKAIGEKATLQEICSWIMNTHDYYRYTDSPWMSSVRHNLSSSRAFLKLERCGGDRGKGFFWKLDEKHSQALEEQEAKNWQTGPGGSQGGAEGMGKRRKDKTLSMLEPPLKRSVKGEPKGAPLPPPLTSTPLPMKSLPAPTTTSTTTSTSSSISSTPTPVTTTTPATTGVFAYSSHPHHAQMKTTPQPSGQPAQPVNASNPYAAWTLHPMSTPNRAPTTFSTSTTANPPSSLNPTTSVNPSQPPVSDVSLPIILGPIPPTHPDYSPSHPHNSAKEGYMILHERTLILDPDVFSGLTKDTLSGLEKMGTIAALQILKEHMVKSLKERRAKGRGRSGKRVRGSAKRNGIPEGNPTAGPFTKMPLERRTAAADAGSKDTASAAKLSEITSTEPAEGCYPPIVRPLAPGPIDVGEEADTGSPILIVDDSGDEGPVAKRRKIHDAPS